MRESAGAWKAALGRLPWAAIGFFAGAFAVVSWPLLVDPTGLVIGHPRSDVWKHIWGHWFVHHGLTTEGAFPLYSDLVRFPTGVDVFVIDPVNSVLSTIVRLLTGLGAAPAYNVVITIDVVLAGLGAYALAREEGVTRGGATIAGTIYAFNPYVLSFGLASGVSENLSLPWIPLALLFLLRTLRRPGLLNPMATGLFYFLTALGTWYYGFVLSMFIALLLAREGLRVGGPLVGSLRPLTVRIDRRAVACVVLALGIGAALTIGPARVFSRTLSSDRSMQIIHAHGTDERVMPRAANVPAMSDFFDPTMVEIEAVADHLYYAHYLGMLVIPLALWGALRERRRGLLWSLAGFAFLCAAMGPQMYVTHAGRLYMHSPLFPVFQAVVPFFDRLHNFVRFCVASNLAIGLLAGMGADRIAGWWMRRSGQGDGPPAGPRWGAIVGALILADYLLVCQLPYPLPHSPTELPRPYAELGEHDEGGMLLLPYRWHRYGLAHHFYYATHHGLGVTLEIAPEETPPLINNGFVWYQRRFPPDSDHWLRPGEGPDPGDEIDVDGGLRELIAAGFTHVTLDLTVADPQEAAGIARDLDRRFELVSAQDDVARIYRLPSLAEYDPAGQAQAAPADAGDTAAAPGP